MARKVSSFSDLIQRVTASCLLHPLGANRYDSLQMLTPNRSLRNELEAAEEEEEEEETVNESSEEEEEISERSKSIWEEEKGSACCGGGGGKVGLVRVGREAELVGLMGQVFESVSTMKRAYASLQSAHSPWDPEKMRVADAAVVAELRRIGVLRERFRRGFKSSRGSVEVVGVGLTAREVAAPYEAAVEELKREVKSREAEVEELKERLKNVSVKKKGKRSQSKRMVCLAALPLSPSPELLESTMKQVTEASKSFADLLLSLMRSARWDIAAAVRSIEAAGSPAGAAHHNQLHHARYALESYISSKIFQGFDHETFYMDGTLLSLLNPDQFRKDCFSQYRDMKSMDPAELLGILPTCQFGVFCTKKYLSILHEKMEESLFGDLEQRRQLLAGTHPRTRFYAEFMGLAKAVWLLHLLAFSLDPPPSHFEASRGAEFHPVYMDSVVKSHAPGQVVGFSVSPAFKLAKERIIKARVYLVPKGWEY